MKKQRPTIPVAAWKLAVHLEATHHIQNQKGTPAYGCDCKCCLNWKACYKELLPNELQEQLLRVGIQLEHRTDIYQYKNDQNGISVRVIYNAVANILSGPNPWKYDEQLGNSLIMYKTIRNDPYLSLIIYPYSQLTHDSPPKVKDKNAGNLITIDFRLDIPSSHIKFDKTS